MAPSTKKVETRLINRNNIEGALRVRQTNTTALFEKLLNNGLKPQKIAYAKRDDPIWGQGNPRPWMNKELSPFYQTDIGAEGDMTGLKNILKNDLKNALPGHYVRGAGNATGDYDEALTLVDNIHNPYFQSQGFICRLPSPELNAGATLKTSKVETDQTLDIGGEGLTCSVLPHDFFLAVEFNSEKWSYTTVLSGEMMWIIWPDTPHNASTIRRVEGDMAKNPGHPPPGLEDIANDLEHGVIWGQKAGDSLVIPPFHIVAGVATKTTVLVAYSHLRIDDFLGSYNPSRVALCHSFYNHETVGAGLRTGHGNGFVTVIKNILNNKFGKNDIGDFLQNKYGQSTVASLVRRWDSIKDNVGCFLSEENKKELQNIWVRFLTQVAEHFGRRCAICNHPITNLEGTKAHVFDQHYPEKGITRTGPFNPQMQLEYHDLGDAGTIIAAHNTMHTSTGEDPWANKWPATVMGPPPPRTALQPMRPNQHVGTVGGFVTGASRPAASLPPGNIDLDSYLSDPRLEEMSAGQQSWSLGHAPGNLLGESDASGQTHTDTTEVSTEFFEAFLRDTKPGDLVYLNDPVQDPSVGEPSSEFDYGWSKRQGPGGATGEEGGPD